MRRSLATPLMRLTFPLHCSAHLAPGLASRSPGQDLLRLGPLGREAAAPRLPRCATPARPVPAPRLSAVVDPNRGPTPLSDCSHRPTLPLLPRPLRPTPSPVDQPPRA